MPVVKSAKLSREIVNEREFTTHYKAILTPPPLWKSDSEEEYRERCKKLCNQAIEVALSKRDKPSMGMSKVMGQDIYKARFTKRGPRPLCRTKCIDNLKEFKTAYFAFKAQFQEASATLREALALGQENFNIRLLKLGVPLFGGCSLKSAT